MTLNELKNFIDKHKYDVEEHNKLVNDVVAAARKVIPTSEECILSKAIEDLDYFLDKQDYERFHAKRR